MALSTCEVFFRYFNGGVGRFCGTIRIMEDQKDKKTGARVVFEAIKKVGVIGSTDDLTPEILALMKETNEAVEFLKDDADSRGEGN